MGEWHCMLLPAQDGRALPTLTLLSLAIDWACADAKQVDTFNKRTDAAQTEIDAASTAYEEALEAKNTQQGKTFKARDDFNVAALHLADEVQLCNQPQPPSTCEQDLKSAQQAVAHTNATQVEENAKLVTAEAALENAFDQQQMAEAAYENVVQLQDKEIARMQGQISEASGAVQEATAAWQDADQKCHSGGRRQVR